MGEKKSFWTTVPGVLSSIAAILTAGIAIYQFNQPSVGNSSVPPIPGEKPPVTRKSTCDESWQWDNQRNTCVKIATIPAKTISVSVSQPLTKVAGRIDFYLNERRLAKPDSKNRARYERQVGAVEAHVPIMVGKTMVGVQREVIFTTGEGHICSLSPIPETTAHLKAMHVRNSVRLEDCQNYCKVSLDQRKKRVFINTKPIRLTIAKRC